MNGFLLINKPIGPTSHDIVDRVRRATGVKTVGHAGTLDPFAEGLLIVGVGREATREFPRLVGLDKHYVATLRLGATSDTDDRTGVISAGQMANGKWPTLENMSAVLKKFTGKIMQLPPVYSAKKIHGKKMYELARAGLQVARSPSPVEVYGLRILDDVPRATCYELRLNVHCSSGTYIRALARDIGEELKTGAYLEELKRTAIGPFTLEESVRLDDLTLDNWTEFLLPNDQIFDRLNPKP